MIILNGNIESENTNIFQNRSFLYGDAVFETLKIQNHKILFWEDHYFRLMASMRIIRMEIPMHFTMENLENEIFELINLKKLQNSRARITVFRDSGGYYTPQKRTVSYCIQAEALPDIVHETPYEVELFKDFHISKQLLSTIKSTNRLINVTGSIFAEENGYQNCLLLNEDKNVVEALNGNLFMIQNNELITPPLSDGCIQGIMRKQILQLARQNKEFVVTERSISPFELQKADELFITNTIRGIQPITQYRKKEYGNQQSAKLTEQLKSHIQKQFN